jgi:hypothetical protein
VLAIVTLRPTAAAAGAASLPTIATTHHAMHD